MSFKLMLTKKINVKMIQILMNIFKTLISDLKMKHAFYKKSWNIYTFQYTLSLFFGIMRFIKKNNI